MKRLTFFLSLSAFVAVVFLFAPSAPAQRVTAPAQPGFGLVQSDYNNYAKLFQKKQEPNLSPSENGNERWRALYRNHRWAEYAAGSEFREPMLDAQTLMGIYLVQDVDHRLSYQIETIIWNKAYLSASLAERITLDSIVDYWSRATSDESSPTYDPILAAKKEAVGEGDDFYPEYELDRLARQRRDIDLIARTRLINPNSISRAMRSEVVVVRNLFDHGESYKNWVLTYYFMREKFEVLDALADMFIFNWDDDRRAKEIQDLMEAALDNLPLRTRIELEVRSEFATRDAEQRSGSTSGGSSSSSDYSSSGYSSSDYSSGYGESGYGMPMPVAATKTPEEREQERKEKEEERQRANDEREDEIRAETERRVRSEAAAEFQRRELRETAYKYVVGIYESSDFHLGHLRQIERYFRNAANAGDPIAQYHLALFLTYLGDKVDPFTDTATLHSEIQKLVAAAETSDVTRERTKHLREQIALEAGLAKRRAMLMEEKVKALWKVEKDKIDMFDTVLLGVRERISSGSGVSGRMQSMGNTMNGIGSGGNSGTSSSGRNNSSSDSSSGSSSSSSSSSSRNSRGSSSSSGY